MNIYVVVEGEIGEKLIYREWIPHANDMLSYASSVDQVVNNNFYIISGGGFPQYNTIIEKAIEDVLAITTDSGNALFDRLVVSVDSEENTYHEKKTRSSIIY